jgi:hypothetical protein
MFFVVFPAFLELEDVSPYLAWLDAARWMSQSSWILAGATGSKRGRRRAQRKSTQTPPATERDSQRYPLPLHANFQLRCRGNARGIIYALPCSCLCVRYMLALFSGAEVVTLPPCCPAMALQNLFLAYLSRCVAGAMLIDLLGWKTQLI